jgi:hypothetical protein
VIARYSDATHYYYTQFYQGTIYVWNANNGWNTSYNGSYAYGTGVTYDVRLQVNTVDSSTVNVKVYVNNMTTPVIDANDTSAGRIVSGNYIGVYIKRSTNNNDETVYRAVEEGLKVEGIVAKVRIKDIIEGAKELFRYPRGDFSSLSIRKY